MASRMAAREKVRRDALIVADRARGLTWAVVAERHGLSERHCRKVWTAHLEAQELPDVDLLDALAEALAHFDAVVEDAALLAERTANDSVRLGAIKARHGALMDRLELMRRCGLLPYDLGLWNYEVDARKLFRAILEVFDRHRVPPEVEEDLAATLAAMTARRNGSSS